MSRNCEAPASNIVSFPEITWDDVVIPTQLDQGEIRSMVAAPTASAALGIKAVYDVDITNPWVELNQPLFERFREYTLVLDEQIQRAYATIGRSATRPPTRIVAVDDLEPFGQAFFDANRRPALREWYRSIPTVDALHPLHHLIPGDQIGGVPVDPETFVVLRLSIDAIAVMNRATLMANIIATKTIDVLSQVTPTSGRSAPARSSFLSVGSGTVLPTARAAAEVFAKSGQLTRLFSVDHDRRASESAEREAAAYGHLLRTLDCRHLMIDRLSDLLEHYGLEPMSMIELSGFLEYVPTVQTSPERQNAAELVTEAYRATTPGGFVLFGQMCSMRPAPAFLAKAVNWSFMQMRSPSEMVDVITATGAIDRRQITIFRPNDDGLGNSVYNLYLIDKD